MSISPIVDAVDINGYLSILAYVYFVPGRLKLHARLHEIDTESLMEIIERSVYEPWDFKASRRWLQKGEMPYPGYCRSPGSEKCLPVLCNCTKLKEIWNKLKNMKTLALWNKAVIVQ